MFNIEGEVIGIVSQILSETSGSEGLGFAVSSNTARRALYEDPGFWSGLTGILLEGDLASLLNVPAAGFLVQNVAQNSPAMSIGLRPSTVQVEIAGLSISIGGDIILTVDDIAMADPNGWERIIERFDSLEPGDEVHVELLMRGKRETVTYLH